MPDDKPEERRHPRQKAISPQLRRFLGPARSVHDQPPTKPKPEPAPPPERETDEPSPAPPEFEEKIQSPSPEFADENVAESEPESEPQRRPTGTGVALAPARELSRKIEMQTVFLIIGGLFLLAGMFYVGKKFEYWKYLITSRNKPQLSSIVPDKFQGLTADELVEQALAAQRLGNWQEAAERFFAAKRKNTAYRGLLFRVGKLHYDHGEFDTADKLFEKSVAFGENVDTASFLRGLIAVGRSNFAAAERFFEAAANAEPLMPAYPYYWAEAIRRDHQPLEAIPVYERALRRFDTDQERTICNFKIRMAMIEAGQTAPLSVEIDAKQQAGPLPVDWLMTAAAIHIREGNIAEALPLIEKARNTDRANLYSLFASCTGDMFFAAASVRNPEIAQACQIQTPPTGSPPR